MNMSQVIRLDSKRSNTRLYSFLWLLILCSGNGYLSLQSWDKDHCAQNELAILMMYKFLQKIKANQQTKKLK